MFGVEKVEFDYQVVFFGKLLWLGGGSIQLVQIIFWGIECVKVLSVWSIIDGFVSVIQVVVFDIGVDYDYFDLVVNIVWCVSMFCGKVLMKFRDCVDQNGYGIYVIGIIVVFNNDIGVVGVVFGVQIYLVRVFDVRGSGFYSDIVIGIEQVIFGLDGVVDKDGDGIIVGDLDDDVVEVISMFFGGFVDDSYFYDMIIQVYNVGIVIVVVSGNEGVLSLSYLVVYLEVIVVGVIDSNDNIVSFSNCQLEVSVLGVDIFSIYLDDSYEIFMGISMVILYVSGVVVFIQVVYYQKYGKILFVGIFDDISKNIVRGIFYIIVDDFGLIGWDVDYGYGVVRVVFVVQVVLG